MLDLKELVRHLKRDDVDELVLVTGFRARLKIGKEHETLDDYRLSNDSIVQLLFAAGGSRHIEGLGPRPKQWTTRVEPMGQIVVTATRRAGDIEATFALKSKAKTIDKPAQRSDPRSDVDEQPSRDRDRDRPAGPRKDARVDSIPARRKSRRDVVAIREIREVRSGARDSRRDSGPPGSRRRFRGDRGLVSRRPSDDRLDPRSDDPPDDPSDDRRRKTDAPRKPPRTLDEPEEIETESDSETKPDSETESGTKPETESKSESGSHGFDLQVSPALEAIAKVTLPGDESRRKKISKNEVYGARRARGVGDGIETPPGTTDEPDGSDAAVGSRSPSPTPTDQAERGISPAPERPSPNPISPPIAQDHAAGVSTSKKRSPYPANLERMLLEARETGASDLHLTAGRPPVLRIATEIVPVGDPLPAEQLESMILGRVPERMKAAFEDEGSCGFAIDLPEGGRFRFNVTRQRTGIKATVRLIARDIPTLESLGLPPEIERATQHHQGLVVISGPTGHGKTSTLAALVNVLNDTKSLHIITVEDPIEYVHPRHKALISQREIGTTTQSFQRALKGSLRQDPDVIVVGELRDTETVRMAIAASETGHLVLGTMNTPSAAKTIDRLIDLFPPGDQPQVRATLAGGLRMIVSQRLVPDHDRNRVYAAAEVLPGSMALWNLIRDNKTFQIPSLQQRGRGTGVIRLNDSLAELVRDGKCSLEDAQKVSESPDELAQAHGRPVAKPHEPDGVEIVEPKDTEPREELGELDDDDSTEKGPRAWLKKVFLKGS